MRTRRVFCSARDQDITVAWPDGPLHPGQAMAAEAPEPVCLELGERCTGDLCPIFRIPRVELAVRLAQAGLDGPDSLRTREGDCLGCGRHVELKIVDPGYGWCPDCHTVQPLSVPPEEEDKALAGT